MLYRGLLNFFGYPGYWERTYLGLVFFGGVLGMYLTYRRLKIGFWLFTFLNFLVGYWFIFILEDVWQHHVLPHVVFSAVFLPFYGDLRSIGRGLSINTIPSWLMRLLLRIGDKWPWFGRRLNKFAIDSLVNVCRHRPHPWSTVHRYISWTSLSDQRYSARHLPAKDQSLGLPDKALVEPLFKQPLGKQRPCPKSTCLFPAFAQYLTDGFIRTRAPGLGEPESVRLQNTSNHQIDMCPLYGRTPAQSEVLRVKSETNGMKGRLKSQIINSEEYAHFLFDKDEIKPEFAILDEPIGLKEFLANRPELRSKIFAFGGDRTNASPQVAMINTLFLREHNRLAAEIEHEHPLWDDERIFQVARNSLIVLFIRIVVEEYINHISPSFQFKTDATVAQNASWNKPNWSTTEFSLLYRWHSLVPNSITWGGNDVPLILTIFNNNLLLGGGLANAFLDMSLQSAGRLGSFNTPDPILNLESRAIEQGRLCELASYADYRAYACLPRPKRFEDVSSDPEVVKILQRAYPSVEDIEFYVGLFAEDPVADSPLPPLLLRLVAVDAFSQALTNPLLSEHVFREETFSKPGWTAIANTRTLGDVVLRNSAGPVDSSKIRMTQAGWQPGRA